jgi:thiol-disulfide isomerase/thioredoxin
MKSLLKLLLLLAVGVYVKTHFFAGSDAFAKNQLLPIDLGFLQGASPEENKPLLVEFWATWCGPCRQSIPHLNEIYAKYHARGLNVVGITDETGSTVENFMRTVPIDYPVALDPQKRYSSALKIQGIPHAFLLDRNGKVVWDGHPMTLMDSKIESLLGP